jgi:hypothetical protein
MFRIRDKIAAMKYGALLLFSALILHAQTTFEIRGTVTEPGFGGIAGAEVRTLVPRPFATFPSAAPEELITFTDVRGQFVIRTGTSGPYRSTARLTGYATAVESAAYVEVDADHPRVDVQIRMVRLGQVTGRILDAETSEPIEGFNVSVVQKQSDGLGGFRWAPAVPITNVEMTAANRDAVVKQVTEERRTKADGTFAIGNMRPGEVAATILPRDPSPWTTGFSPGDLKVIDREYDILFWPGGVSADAVRPITLGSGSVASFGDILLAKTPHYRAHVSLAQGTCPMGESMRVTLYRRDSSSATTEVLPCGSDLLLRQLEPGSYVLYAVSDWQGYRENIEDAAWATAEFEISDKNTEVALVPQHGVMIEGRLVAAEGVTTLPDQFTIGVRPEQLVPGAQPALEEFTEWLPDGKFRMAVSPRALDFGPGVGRPFYVKQLRYNGTPLPGLHVPLSPGASVHRLEIVLDDKLGSLAGSVADASPQSVLILRKDDARDREIVIPVGNGAFRYDALVPGEYRAIAALRADLFGLSLNPQTGEKVTIRAGETTTLNVRATGTSR